MCKSKRKIRKQKEREVLQAGCGVHCPRGLVDEAVSLAISAHRNRASMDELARDQLSKGHLIEMGCPCAFPFANRS